MIDGRRSHERGLPLRLHDLEGAVMDVVWSCRWAAFSVGDVRDALAEERDLAYTTVMTTVARLHRKGLLDRRRDGRRYLYVARMTREAFLEATAREILDASVSRAGALALLTEKVSEASTEDLDALEASIRRRRKELRR